jgi:hypothetical protein
LTADRRQDAGSAVILKFPSGGVQLEGTIVPLRDSATAAVAVDRESRPSAGPAHRLQADDPVSTPSLQAVN